MVVSYARRMEVSQDGSYRKRGTLLNGVSPILCVFFLNDDLEKEVTVECSNTKNSGQRNKNI